MIHFIVGRSHVYRLLTQQWFPPCYKPRAPMAAVEHFTLVEEAAPDLAEVLAADSQTPRGEGRGNPSPQLFAQ